MRFFYFLLMLFCLVRPAFAVTQYWYVTTTGAGANSGGTRAWATLPNSAATAMSAAQFNNPNNWSAIENANKIDPNDVIYPKGSWTSVDYKLVPVYGCTIDGWENGTFDPSESSTWNTEPVFSRSKILVNVNNVTIKNMRFKSFGGSSVAFGLEYPGTDGDHFTRKTSGHLVTNSYWYMDASVGVQLHITFITDSEISHNYVYGVNKPWTPEKGYGYRRWFAMNGGSRNKISYNNIVPGITGLYFNLPRKIQYSPVPSSGSYHSDPDYNMQYNEISYNTINRYGEDHEGISFDNTDNTNIGVWERDTVASVNGKIITLSHPGFATAGKDYSGTYLVNIGNTSNQAGNQPKYGRHSLIAAQSGATITLEEAIPNLAVGDTVVIGHAWRRNWIHNNTFPASDRGFDGLSTLLEGISLENIVEYNNLQLGIGTIPKAIVSQTIMGQYLATDPVYAWNNSVTKLPTYSPAAYNIIRYNTAGMIQSNVYYQEPPLYLTPLYQQSWNTAIYGNTLLSLDQNLGGYRIVLSHVYIPAGEVSKIRNCDGWATDCSATTTSSILATDPTDDSWLTGKARKPQPPVGDDSLLTGEARKPQPPVGFEIQPK